MPTLTVTKTYDDGQVLNESDLDAIKSSIETFINSTKLDADNIQVAAIVDDVVAAMDAANANAIAALMTATGADAIGDAMTSAGADLIGASMTATGANAVASTMTSTGADAIGSDMTSTGANAIASARTRETGTTVAAGGVARSASSGTFNTTSTSATDATNLSVTITTTGKPVRIELQQSTSSGGLIALQSLASTTSAIAQLRILRGVTDIGNQFFQFSGITNGIIGYPPGSFSMTDTTVQGSAGTYTYKLQASVNAADQKISITNCNLVAYEL
jgi:hypothetical protein